MIDVAEFLLARFADDEQYARTVLDDDRGAARVALPGGQTRVLAECEAKRRIVALADAAAPPDLDPVTEHHAGNDGPWVGSVTLKLLALPYADHLDFLEEWKP